MLFLAKLLVDIPDSDLSLDLLKQYQAVTPAIAASAIMTVIQIHILLLEERFGVTGLTPASTILAFKANFLLVVLATSIVNSFSARLAADVTVMVGSV